MIRYDPKINWRLVKGCRSAVRPDAPPTSTTRSPRLSLLSPNAPNSASPWNSSRASASGSRFPATSEHASPPGHSTNSARSSPTRPNAPEYRSSRWTRPTPRSAARAAATPREPTGPLGTTSTVVGAASLGRPTTSPGSTSHGEEPRRGYSSTCPIPSPAQIGTGKCDPSPSCRRGQSGASAKPYEPSQQARSFTAE